MIELRNRIRDLFARIDKLWIRRARTLNTEALVFISHQKAIVDRGLQHVIAVHDIKVSAAAVCKARQKVPAGEFRKALPMFSSEGRRVLAIDGSKVHIPPSFGHHGFKTRTNDQPVGRPAKRIMCMLSSLVDTSTRCCVDFTITKHFNERTAAQTLFRSTKKNDIVLFDRGYYSFDLTQTMLEKDIDFVIRLKKDAFRGARAFYNSRLTKTSILAGGRVVHLVKYMIDGSKYMCLTSLDQSSKEVRDIYKRRWRVEEHFKRIKSHMHIERNRSLLPRTFLIDVEIAVFLDAVSLCIHPPASRDQKSQVLLLWSLFSVRFVWSRVLVPPRANSCFIVPAILGDPFFSRV